MSPTATSPAALFGGTDVKNSTINADVVANLTNVSGNIIMGGSNLLTATADNEVILNGDVTMNLTNVVSKNYVCGGSLIANYGQEDRGGNITVNIAGGSYSSVAGGSLIQCKNNYSPSSQIDGNITVNFGGNATASYLYGASLALYNGPTASESVTGNVSVTVDLSQGASVSTIVGGGAGKCEVGGDVSITIKGAGTGYDSLATKTIIGDSAGVKGDAGYVAGMRSLNFVNFDGVAGSSLRYFDTYTVDATSSVTFFNLGDQFGAKNWTISADSADRVSVTLRGNSDMAFYDMDMSGSELNFNCDLADGEEWTVFKVLNDDESSSTIYNLDGASIILNGDELTQEDEFLFTGENYQLEYRFEELEDGTFNGCLVASKIPTAESEEAELAISKLA